MNLNHKIIISAFATLIGAGKLKGLDTVFDKCL
jgi:hypothetical protein